MESWRRYVGLVLILVVFGVAASLLYRELSGEHYHEIVASLAKISPRRLLTAMLLTAVSYTLLISYDWLAMREVGHKLPWWQVALASFGGFVTSYNFGILLGGTSVRYRLYSLWGYSTLEIVRLVAMVSATFWVGMCALGGLLFTIDPIAIPERFQLPFADVRIVGYLLLALLVAYWVWCYGQRKPITIRGVALAPPRLSTALLQTVVAIADLLLATAVLFVLMPESLQVSYPHFVAAYLLAIVIVLGTHVPGGLGVLELAMISLLSPTEPEAVLGGILIYRVIYYLLPLAVAAALLGINELARRRADVGRAALLLGQVTQSIGPRIIALLILLAGAMLLFSGVTPVVAERLHWLRRLLPLPVVEVSHFLGSVIGMALLIVGQGLRRRLDAAYWITQAMLLAGAVFSLLKGFDYEEAALLLAISAMLWPMRRQFHRRGRLLDQPWTPGWLLAVTLVLVCTVAIGLFVYKRVDYTQDLWWTFTFQHGDASRFLRAMFGVLCLGLLVALATLLRPAPPREELPTPEQLVQAATIVNAARETQSQLALLGDKSLLFNEAGSGFVMYGVCGRSWIALGDPVAPPDEQSELAWDFRERCDYYHGWPVFYQVNQQSLPIYLDLGLNLLKLGEEARVRLTDFSLEGRSRKSLRQAFHHLERDGLEFVVLPAEQVETHLPRLRAISDQWLESKKTREKRFSLGFFDDAYLRRNPLAVIRRGAEIQAFANVWTGAEHHELSVDLMRHGAGAPPGVMDQLFIGLMLWGKSQGYEWFNLGMAPLAGLENRQLAPLWHKAGGMLYRHGENFYNFEGLREYKDKFEPIWRPKYLASPGGWALPIILANVATLVAGGMRGVIGK